ncbi:hypothetical protein ABT369_15510 [Dactylosporangium sp. NPDC000244]|uniref:hypothetical protein n=1 Tax=Dactylosporangium sp. NPDC000244 TaxID=3154365 RepID=UPI00331D9240
MESVIEAMTDITMLEYGWDGEQAQPLSDRAFEMAITILVDTMSIDTVPPQIVPTYDGGLQLEWHCAGVDLEVAVESNGQVSVWFRESGREWEEERYPRARLSKELSLLTRAYVD